VDRLAFYLYHVRQGSISQQLPRGLFYNSWIAPEIRISLIGLDVRVNHTIVSISYANWPHRFA